MNGLLRKIKLIENFSISSHLSPSELKLSLELSIEKTSFGLLDSFSSNRAEFMGEVTNLGFKLRRTPKSFSKNDRNVLVIGKFKELNNETEINITINGFDLFYKLIYSVQLILLIGAVVIYNNPNSVEFESSIFINFIGFTIALALMFIPYFQRKMTIHQLKHDLERELFFLNK